MSSYFAHSMSSNERDLELASTDSSGWPSPIGTPYMHPLCTGDRHRLQDVTRSTSRVSWQEQEPGHRFIYPFAKYLSSSYYVPGSGPGVLDCSGEQDIMLSV